MGLPAKFSRYLHQQISESLRADIAAGKIAVGTRLPTMGELAKSWGTSYFTIQRAFAPLVREGLIESRGKLGTVVIGAKPALTTVGIYYGSDIWRIPEAAFYRSIHQELCQQIEASRMIMRPFIEPRPEGQHGTPHPEILRMVQEREIQGLIIPTANKDEMRWVSELPIPKSYFGGWQVPWRVSLDSETGLRLALTKLRDHGVRDVALAAALSTSINPPGGGVSFYDKFVNLLSELGLRTQNHWCAMPQGTPRPHELERFGYESFCRIWNTDPANRPAGMLCVCDVVGRGVLAAVLGQQIAVPDELKIVQYKNMRTGFFTPLNVDWIQWDEASVASTLLRQLLLQIDGREPQPILIPPCRETDPSQNGSDPRGLAALSRH